MGRGERVGTGEGGIDLDICLGTTEFLVTLLETMRASAAGERRRRRWRARRRDERRSEPRQRPTCKPFL